MHKERVHNIKTEPKAKKSAERLPKPEKPPKSQKKPKSPKPQKVKPGPIMIPNLPIKPKKVSTFNYEKNLNLILKRK